MHRVRLMTYYIAIATSDAMARWPRVRMGISSGAI